MAPCRTSDILEAPQADLISEPTIVSPASMNLCSVTIASSVEINVGIQFTKCIPASKATSIQYLEASSEPTGK